MNSSEIEDVYHRCGGRIKVYKQKYPTPLLVTCLKCDDYFNTDTLEGIEMCSTKTIEKLK